MQVLKLNAGGMPIDIISWQDAVSLWWSNKAYIREVYEDKVLHTGKTFVQRKRKEFMSKYNTRYDSWESAMYMPAVIQMADFIKPNQKVRFYKPFTRRNVYERDNGQCQYCGKPLSLNKMTFDHVIPRSQNGLTSWKNIVCSCLKCNTKKGGKTPKEAGMNLIQKPYAPKISDNFIEGMIKKFRGIKNILNNEKWRGYIYWNVEMEDER